MNSPSSSHPRETFPRRKGRIGTVAMSAALGSSPRHPSTLPVIPEQLREAGARHDGPSFHQSSFVSVTQVTTVFAMSVATRLKSSLFPGR